jgi:uncharacterized protein YwgA
MAILENEKIRVENGTDMILALLYAGGSRKAQNEEVVGNTRLVKLLFLLAQETSLKKYMTDFNYDAYNFGPFSPELFDALQALINAGLVKAVNSDSEGYLDEADRFHIERQVDEGESAKNTIIYTLTSDGELVGSALFQALSKAEQNELITIKRVFNSSTLRKLLQYVYRKYPKFKTEYIIKDYVY